MATGDVTSLGTYSGFNLNYQSFGTTWLGQGTGSYYLSYAQPSGSAGSGLSQTSTSSSTESLPADSIRGQAWGRVIPITAGERCIPGRPVWRKVYRGTDGTWYADTAISFGWRAEMRAGIHDTTLDWGCFLANGTSLAKKVGDTVTTLSGLTVEFRDGTQTTQDVLDPSEDQPAYIFHMVMYAFGIPLKNFQDRFPDAWDLVVADDIDPDGIALSRAIELLYAQTRLLNGKVDIDPAVEDKISSLFLVENQEANAVARSICRFCNLDVREELDRLSFRRVVSGTSYTVNSTISDDILIRAPSKPTVTVTRAAEQRAPLTLIGQFIANEASFKFSERPARRITSPVATTTSNRTDTIRVPFGMAYRQGQTYISQTLFRETTVRNALAYAVPWVEGIKVQPCDVHEVSDGDFTYFVKVNRADTQPDRTVSIQGERLPAGDYEGAADMVTPDMCPACTCGQLEYANTAGLTIPDGAIMGGAVADFARDAVWQVYSEADTGITVQKWSISGQASAATVGAVPFISGVNDPSVSVSDQMRRLTVLPVSGHLFVCTSAAINFGVGCYVINPATPATTDTLPYSDFDAIHADSETRGAGWHAPLPVTPPSASERDCLFAVLRGDATQWYGIVYDYDGSALTERTHAALTLGSGSDYIAVYRGVSSGAEATFFLLSYEASATVIYRVTVTYSGASSASFAQEVFYTFPSPSNFAAWLVAASDGGMVVVDTTAWDATSPAGDGTRNYELTGLDGSGAERWTATLADAPTTGLANYWQLFPEAGVFHASITDDVLLVPGRDEAWNVDLISGAVQSCALDAGGWWSSDVAGQLNDFLPWSYGYDATSGRMIAYQWGDGPQDSLPTDTTPRVGEITISCG